MPNELTDRDWLRLVRTIERGSCVLLLGADVATDPSGQHTESLSVLLAHELAADLPAAMPVANPDDLAHVAELYVSQRDRDRTDLEMLVEEFYRPYRGQSTPFHECLAALPFALCITTTPDQFLQTAFQAVTGKTPATDFYHFRSGRVPHLKAPSAERPLLYGLYGDLANSESLVLTETDLLDFLVKVISKSPELPSELVRQFADPDMSFLFLGFGFQRWYLRMLLHVLRTDRPRSRSFALEDASFFSLPDEPQTAVFYDHAHAIEFKHCSWTDFARELRRRYQEATGRPEPATAEPPADAPTVFLCHSNDDRDRVAELGQRLRERGLKTWRDRDKLQGGDNWDRTLVHVIRNQVDYVLVLHTPNMLGEAESYVYKEIKIALERQQKFAEGHRFVLPAFLIESGKLP